MKITESELNQAYARVNEYKNGPSQYKLELVELVVERNPLTDNGEDEEFVSSIKLVFKFDETMGRKGAYYLITENIEIVEDSNDNTN